MNSGRCPSCGAQLALVGRLHLCRKDVRLAGAIGSRGLGLGRALERPKPRLAKPVNRAVNGPVNAAVNKVEKRKAYLREKMRARRAAARAAREDKAGQGSR